MSTATPHRFENPVWEIGEVLGWLIDRDAAKFGRIVTIENLRGAKRYEVPYEGGNIPERILLHALQRGDLTASDTTTVANSASISREYWKLKNESDIQAEIARQLKFWRDDVLRLWPDIHGSDRSRVRVDIAAVIDARRWMIVDQAIELVAIRNGISTANAWQAVKTDLSRGELPALCLDDLGERVVLEPHWIDCLAKFGPADQPPKIPTEPGTIDQPIRPRDEPFQIGDVPSGGILWFDRTRALENRLARSRRAGKQLEVSLPPHCARDIVVDRTRLDELHSNNATETLKSASVTRASPKEERGSTRRPSRLKPYWSAAHEKIDGWLMENGCPAAGDGEQSKLETRVSNWLARRGHYPAKSTIRQHVTQRMSVYRAALCD